MSGTGYLTCDSIPPLSGKRIVGMTIRAVRDDNQGFCAMTIVTMTTRLTLRQGVGGNGVSRFYKSGYVSGRSFWNRRKSFLTFCAFLGFNFFRLEAAQHVAG